MKKVILSIFLLTLTTIVLGCSHENDEGQNLDTPSLEMIEVSIQVPEKISLNEKVKIQATVIQGKDKVADADEVKFEIWKGEQGEHEKLEAENEGEGIYSIDKTFSENGQYTVIAHVTARSMHSMPRIEFTVGTEEQSSTEETVEEESHEDGHHDQQDTSVKIEFDKKITFQVNQEANLTTSIKQGGAPLENAKVKFEIIFDENDKHEWLDAEVVEAGIYSTSTTFKQAGTYHIQIHVNKGTDIHEHKISMFNVQ